ncbi:MAG: zinc-ribbon domain-containing protein [Desulfobacterales bacterium]|nr:zinc-ribbon domain-containing protein [Desulfobacterales bacterium]MDJ0915168.1 zinc-ribbon domain-containing protein [Desulfobacterales bacterium]
MNIVCEHCESKFRIPDEKVPSGRAASFKCPKCQSKISITPEPETLEGDIPSFDFQEDEDNAIGAASSESYDAEEKPFDFIEEEGKTAMVCETSATNKKHIIDALEFMEYHITDAGNVRDALKKMRYHIYDLIVVNEEFGTSDPDSNGVLIYLERLNMAIRRNIFVTLISKRFRTMDNMMSMHRSVNQIINVKNIKDIDKILKSGIADNEFFYRIYKESFREIGGV